MFRNKIAFIQAILLVVMITPLNSARATTLPVKLVSPAMLLNPDGTLRLDENFSGSLDLKGWNVQLDSIRGPVFAEATDPLATALDTWYSLGNNGAGDGSLNSSVSAIAVSGSNVYVGGDFTNVNNKGTVLGEADYIARWDGSNWHALGNNGAGDGSLNDEVTSIAVSGSNLYVGGRFTDVNNKGTVRYAADYVTFWSGSDWYALGHNGAGNGSINGDVLSIAVNGSDVYVGGWFDNVSNYGTILGAADFIAHWDGSNWYALGSNGAGSGSLDQGVYAIAVSGSNLYVGGCFTNVNDNGTVRNSADYIALWNGSNWYGLGHNGAGNGSLNGNVYAIAMSGSDLFVGGAFTDVNNKGTVRYAADYIAFWNGSDFYALGSNGAGDGSIDFIVNSIAVNKSGMYAGGYFTNVNNNGTLLGAADYVARWDGSNWHALGSNGAGDGSLNSVVNALALRGSNIFVGGIFTDVNNNGTVLAAADRIARLAQKMIFTPQATNDGWILESGEASNVGGKMDSTSSVFYVGDNARRKQYRDILSFNTASLPDTAVITKVTLKLKLQGTTGANPFNTHGNLLVDIKKGAFGGANALALGDFKATASKSSIGSIPKTPVSGWYTKAWTSGIFTYINKTGVTQFRLRFTKDDDNDAVADYLKFYSGNAGTASYRPQLIIEYYVP